MLATFSFFKKKIVFKSSQHSACKPPIPGSGLKATLVIDSSVGEWFRGSPLIGRESGELIWNCSYILTTLFLIHRFIWESLKKPEWDYGKLEFLTPTHQTTVRHLIKSVNWKWFDSVFTASKPETYIWALKNIKPPNTGARHTCVGVDPKWRSSSVNLSPSWLPPPAGKIKKNQTTYISCPDLTSFQSVPLKLPFLCLELCDLH